MSANLQDRLSSQRKTTTMSSFKKFMLISFGFIFLFITVSLGAFYWFIGGAFEKKGIQRNVLPASSAADTDDYLTSKVNILVMGVDLREDGGRSDTMFVITLDPDTKQISMLSLPRDTRVQIPKHGWDKINHAFAFGGINLAKTAAESLLGIPMDYYAAIDFNAFHKIIDALGGININVEKRMYYEDPYDDLVIDLRRGEQTLNGKKALHYVRYRDEEGDIGRIERQQKFIRALLEKAANPLTLTRLPSIISEVTSAVKTNMSTSEMLGLAKFLSDAAKSGLKAQTVPGLPTYIDGVNYWIPDVLKLRNQIAITQGMTNDKRWLASSKTQAELYENSIPARAVFDEPFYGFKNESIAETEQAQLKKAQAEKTSAQDKQAKTDIDSDERTSDEINSSEKKLAENNLTEKNTAGKNSTEKPADKLAQTPKKPEKEPESKPVMKPSEPVKPQTSTIYNKSSIRVNILNASGSAEAGSKMASAMRREGFEVIGVSASANTNLNTIIIANTADNSLTGKLTSLPFRYALQINDNPARANQVTVIVGKDYL